MEAPDTFCYLNRRGRLMSAADWNAAGYDKLWLYNLHYFEDLNAAANATRAGWHRNLISRWVKDNPPGHGNGWEPYPLSLRIVNWIKWALAGNSLEASWVHSLAVQTRFLHMRLEWHLLGNHLFANAKALIFAGLFFDGPEAEGWRATGVHILARELPEQVLGDGGHFELSPMYHAIIQEDLLDLINLARVYPDIVPNACIEGWTDALRRMRSWLAAMSHPDGEIAFFNDAALGVAAAPAELELYAERLDLPPCGVPSASVTHLEQSGYVRVRLGDVVAFLDVGRVGPDYLPGHAHADSLSFELAVAGQRVVVNTGTSVYGTGPERLRQRSTVAHSTVEVEGKNSSEVWGGFRVARRARPFGLEIECKGEEVSVRCAHDGYRRLPGQVTHWREWCFGPKDICIADLLEGGFTQAVSRLHFHPDVRIVPEQSAALLPDGHRLGYDVKRGSVRVVPDTYHPRFGVSIPAQCLEAAFSEASCEIRFSLPQRSH